jgi:hypothetical protein
LLGTVQQSAVTLSHCADACTYCNKQAAELAQQHAAAMKAAQSALEGVEKGKRAVAAELRGQVTNTSPLHI